MLKSTNQLIKISWYFLLALVVTSWLYIDLSRPAFADTQSNNKTTQQTLANNYNLAKALEEKSLLAMSKAEALLKQDPHDPNAQAEFRKALLYGLEVQRLPLKDGQEAIDASSLQRLLVINRRNISREFHRISHIQYTGPDFDFVKDNQSFIYSPDSKQIAIILNNKIQLRNAYTGQIIKKLAVPPDELLPRDSYRGELVYSPDGKIIASRSADRDIIYFWDLSSGELIHTKTFESGFVYKFAFSADGKMLVVELSDWYENRTGKVIVLNIESDEEMTLPVKHYSGTTDFIFSHDGQLIAAIDSRTSRDDKIKIWETKSRKLINSYSYPSKQYIQSMVFSTDNKSIFFHSNIIKRGEDDKPEAVTSTDSLRVLDLESGKISKEIKFCHFKNDSHHNCSLSFNPNGKVFVTNGSNLSGTSELKIWETNKFTVTNRFSNRKTSQNNFSSIDGVNIVVKGADQTFRIDGPIYRLLNEFDPGEVSDVLQFLWELKFDGSTFIHSLHPQSPKAQNSHIAWTDETRKYQPLMETPQNDEMKLDQVVIWLEKRCAYRNPVFHGCKP
jgi:WD40 repeat protein